MRILSAEEVDAALDDLALIDRLEAAFRAGCRGAACAIITICRRGTLLLMPAWTSRHLGIKLVTVFPDNVKRALPSVFGQYVLLDGSTGQPLALLDGTMLTKRRTACASGLAARYLAPHNAARLLMIGTGALAPHLVRVHAKVRPIREVAIWGRRPAQAEALAQQLAASLPAAIGRPIAVRAVTDRKAAVGEADVVSCATLSKRAAGRRRMAARRDNISTWSAPTPPRCAKATTRRCGARGSMSTRARAR